MIPWFFAYDKSIMQDIWCTTHKWQTFQWIIVMYIGILWKVIFSVQLAGKSPFGRILMDHTIDVTVNKDTTTTGIMTRPAL